MKLLNREPTEEMIKAAGLHYESEKYTGCTSTFKAMYDAAPEIKVDMEPVAWMCEGPRGAYFGKADGVLRPGSVNLYSAEQFATLQAENERLKKSCEYNFALYQDMGVKVHELVAERDELLSALKALLTHTPKEEWRGGQALLQVINQTEKVLAKYEGKNHD